MVSQQPTFIFYRSLPSGPTAPSIASSLQGLETSFFLIALGRYPHALATCASAIETTIKRSPSCTSKKTRFVDLIFFAKNASTAIAAFPQSELDAFREARNRIMHRGFSPRDDSESASLLIRVGFPFAALCLRELHSFDLMDGLIKQYAYHLDVARRVYEKAQDLAKEFKYCFNSFSQYLQWCVRDNFLSNWEFDALENGERSFVKFDRIKLDRGKLEREFNASWSSFDCPVCDDIDSTVVELDDEKLDLRKIVPLRMVCSNCGFIVRSGQPFLSETLLEPQIAENRPLILTEYGLSD